MVATTTGPPGADLLTVRAVSKRFGATRALSDVDLDLRRGERVAVMGENGAGKSTLMKVLAGVHAPDSGAVTLEGEPFAPAGPAAALAAGVSTVYQEPAVFSHLSVLENLFAGRIPRTRTGSIDSRAMTRDGRSLFERLGLPARNLTRRMDSLSLGEQQQVLIARAVAVEAKVLILDEPTSILTDAEARTLFSLVDGLAASGAGILYITHRFDELDKVADRFVVLRDGALAGELDRAAASKEALLALMGGRDAQPAAAPSTHPEHARAADAPPVLEVRGLAAGSAFTDISFEVAAGEVLGLYGLVGAGRSEVALAAFGALPVDRGSMHLRGEAYSPRSTRDALAKGIAYLPEDRKSLGLFGHMDVGENLAVTSLRTLSPRFGVVSRVRERGLVATWMDRLRVKAASSRAAITSLSGGNQQKVLLARAVATQPQLLILDEPTRGIDVATKAEIHRDVEALAAQGVAVLLISSELPELLALAHRVAVLREGRMVSSFAAGEAREQTVLAASMGVAA